jgi:hypothetical protein
VTDGLDGVTETPVRWRAPAAVIGVAALAFGMLELVSGAGPLPRLWSSVLWLAGVLIAHDVVLAPLTVAAGWALSRRLSGRAVRRIVAGGLLVAGSLVAVAVPALLTPRVADNPTATPRDYLGGLALALAVTAAVTILMVIGSRLRRR